MPNISGLPTVTSIAATDPTVTDAGTVHYTVTFSEAVTGVTADQFGLIKTGTLLGSGIIGVTSVAGSNGTSYVVSVSSGTGEGTLALQLTGGNVKDSSGYPVGPFQFSTEYAAGGGYAAVGDINGDGRLDVVTSAGYNASSGYLSVMLNDGNGGLGAPTRIESPTSQVMSTALADLDGDGKLDLLYGRGTTGQLGVRLGNGDGTFGAETSFAVGSGPAKIVVADLNGDGHADAIVANKNAETASVLIGNGDGTFKPQVVYVTGAPFNGSGYVATADFNNDGKLDLAVLNSPGFALLLGNGDGTFQPRTTHGSYSTSSIASGDFNGDGDIDIATLGSTSISIFLGQGNGSFAARPLMFLPSERSALASADLDGDGKLDLIASGGGSFSILYGVGDGSFRSPTVLPVAGGSEQFSIADLNGDGEADIIAPDLFTKKINVFLSDPADSAAPAYTIHRPAPALAIFDAAVTPGTDGRNYINAANFNGGRTTLTGFATPGDLIKVTNASTGSIVGTTTVGADGAWAMHAYGHQNGQTYNYVASTTNGAGSPVSGPAFTFTVDTSGPLVSITDIEPLDNTGRFNLIGQSEAGATIIINQQVSAPLGSVTSNADGSWVLLDPTLTAEYSRGTLSAQATDAAGNTASSPWTDIKIVSNETVYANSTAKYLVTGSLGYLRNGLLVEFSGAITGAHITSGAFVQINSGGRATNSKLYSGSLEINYGTSVGSIVMSGAIQHNYGTATGTTVAAGGFRNVFGTATDTSLSGDEQVRASGTANHTVIAASGRQFVAAGGTSNNTVVQGLQYVAAGGNDTGATIDGGTQYLLGTASSATVRNGGVQLHYGSSTGTIVGNGGIQHVYGGIAGGTQIAAGGYQDVTNATVTNTLLAGDQDVRSNGLAVVTTIESGGRQYVGAGGASSNTLVKTGGLQNVDVGGNDSGAIIDGGSQYVAGTSNSATVRNGGIQYHYGSSTGTVVGNGGTQYVLGGTAYGAQVAAGGFQQVTNATVLNTVLAGNQQVRDNGVAIATTIEAGGRQYVGAGGSSSYTVITTGGLQYIDAGASDSLATVDGGFQYVEGTATGTTVRGGGEQDVAAGGTAINTHLADGSEHVMAGGLAQGIDFGGDAAATLVLDTPEGLAGSIANWGDGDRIDFRNTTISSFDIDSSNHLTIVTSGGDIYSWDLLTQYSASSFVLAPDGSGGTMLSYEPPQALLAAA